MKYYLWLTHDTLDYMDEEHVYDTLEEALKAVNEHSSCYSFRLMKGEEIKLKVVEYATKYEVGE